VFWGCELRGIAVLNTVKLLCAVLEQELGTLCCLLCCEHCVVGLWFRHCVRSTVLGVLWRNTKVTQASALPQQPTRLLLLSALSGRLAQCTDAAEPPVEADISCGLRTRLSNGRPALEQFP